MNSTKQKITLRFKSGLNFFIILILVLFLVAQSFASQGEIRESEDFIKMHYPEFTGDYHVNLGQDSYIKKHKRLLDDSRILADKDRFDFVKKMFEAKGVCLGLTTVWLYSKWLQYMGLDDGSVYNRFKDTKKAVVLWNGEDRLSEIDLENCLWLDSLVHYHNFPEDYISRVDEIELDVILNSGKLDLKGRALKRKYSVTSIFTEEKLADLLKNIAYEGELIFVFISGLDHVVGLFKDKGCYYFYDPNNRYGVYKDTEIGQIAFKIICAHNRLVERQQQCVDGRIFVDGKEMYDLSEADSITIMVVADSDKNIGNYPDHEEFLSNSELNEHDLWGAISSAANVGCAKSLKVLLQQGDNLDSDICKLMCSYILLFMTIGGPYTEHDLLEVGSELLKRIDPNKIVNIRLTRQNGTEDFKITKPGQLISGKATLHLSAWFNNERVVKILLNDERTDVNLVDMTPERRTPLMRAAENGHVEIVRMLLAKDADKNIKDANGKTAYMLAEEKGVVTDELKKLLMPDDVHDDEL